MHSHLQLDTDSKCSLQIERLLNCHKVNRFKRFIGECNQVKEDLNLCLYGEFLITRKANKLESDNRKNHFEELKKEFT